jgi:hypothetical protein
MGLVCAVSARVGAQRGEGAATGVTVAPWARPFVSSRVIVQTDGGKVSGRLVSADEEKVIVDVRNAEPWGAPRYLRTPVKLETVQRVSVQKDDSIVNGVLIGAAAMLACLKWVGCSQGFDGRHNGRDWALATAFGATLGGGFDATIHAAHEIYRRPDRVRAGSTASTAAVGFRVRF